MKKIFTLFAAMLVALTVSASHTTIGSDDPKEVHPDVLKTAAASFDTIYMKAGIYTLTDRFDLSGEKLIKAISDTVVIKQYKDNQIKNGAKVHFEGIFFDGSAMRNSGSDFGFNTQDVSAGKELRFDDCEFYGYNDIIIWGFNTNTLDSCIINNCYFHNNKKQLIYFDASKVENQQSCKGIKITNSTFANTDSLTNWRSVIEARPYGSATTDAIEVYVNHCTFYNNPCVDGGHANIRTHCLSNVKIYNSIFVHPTALAQRATYCDTGADIQNCMTYNFTADGPKGHAWGSTVNAASSIANPQFTDAANGDFTLAENSPAVDAGTDGKTLGDPRWWPVISYPETDFAAPGYDCTADDATFAATTKYYLDESTDPNSICYNDENTPGPASWTIKAIRAGYIQATLDLGEKGSNWHNFEVKVLDEDGNPVDSISEGKPWVDEYGEKNTTKTISGKLAIPEAGIYTIQLTNKRHHSKSAIYKVTLTYLEALPASRPTVAAKGDWDTWTNELTFTMDANAKTATVKKNFTEGDELWFKMLINGTYVRDNGDDGWWFYRKTNECSGINRSGDGKNMKFIADYTGEYTLRWYYETNSLVITYPTIPTITIYYVNKDDWSTVKAFPFAIDNYVAWPGEDATKTKDKYLDHDIYSYNQPVNRTKVIFNDGGSNQTADLTLEAGKPYFYNGVWYATLPSTPTAVDNTVVSEKAAKVLRNGQLFIEKDGKTYNVLGTVVK